MSTEGTSENDTSEVKESEVAEQQKETASQQDVEQAQKDVEQTELQSEPDEAESDTRETAENSETDESENAELKEAPADDETETPETKSEDPVYDMELQPEPEMTEDTSEESTPVEAETEPDESAETESAADDEVESVEDVSAADDETKLAEDVPETEDAAEPTEDVSAADTEEKPAESVETEPSDTNEPIEADAESGEADLSAENAETETGTVEPENTSEPSETTEESENAPAETAADASETEPVEQADVPAAEETENTETPVENTEKTEPEAEAEPTPEEPAETEAEAVDETEPVEPAKAETEAAPAESEAASETDEAVSDDTDAPAENAEAKAEPAETETAPAEDGEAAAEQTETEAIPDAEPFTVEENGETAESDSAPENAAESAEGNEAADVESIPEAEPFEVEKSAEETDASNIESIPGAEPFTVEESAEDNDMLDIPENYEEFSIEDMPISDETRENLKDFEQENWDNLSQVEKEEAVEKLRDSIAEDLQLENKPEVAYYNHEDAGDFGGYAASNNTIYINRYTMGDAAETADTVAHESRHCWQHERAENPQTEQDYVLKENLEHYISPDEDFEAYLDQMVEQDAREYAGEVTSQIPEAEEETDEPPMLMPEIVDEDAEHEGTRGPPTEVSESKTVDVLPEDFEAKYEAKLYQKFNESGIEIYQSSAGNLCVNSRGEVYKELTDEEKSILSEKGKEIINSASKQERGDFRVPGPEKIKGVTPDGHIEENWTANTDGAVDGTRHMEIPQAGQIIDRIGGEKGNFFSPLKPDGQPYTLKERATGDYLPEENIEDNASYHQYLVKDNFTENNFQEHIDTAYREEKITTVTKNQFSDRLKTYYNESETATSYGCNGEAYIKSGQLSDGVRTAEISPMFIHGDDPDGGGVQYIMPFNVEELRSIGLIELIEKK